MIITCQCGFISQSKCTILMGDVDKREGCACVEAEGNEESSVPSSHFYYESKTALKKKKN